jgi:uncharacterized protein (DUF1501 family)
MLTPRRRDLIRAMGSAPLAFAIAPAWGQATHLIRGRLVVVFLRGAYDGLSMLIPHGDAHYAKLRSTIAIRPPDGTLQTALPLDELFGLHPSCEALLPLWHTGVLSALTCVGSPDSSRSHFDAQYHWETGKPGSSAPSAGWLNALSGLMGDGLPNALGVGETSPRILTGPRRVQLVASGQAALNPGALANPAVREAILRMYGSDEGLSRSIVDGANSRMETSRMLRSTSSAMTSQEQMAANNGAGAPQGLALDARNLGQLMDQNRQLRLGFLSAGGWDTHINQGGATGQLANNLANLSRALVQLRPFFSEPHDLVVVVSEFGRTCAENGTRGTDHGRGNILWLMGNAVRGGQWHGQWSGLAPEALVDRRDLPVHHDFRALFAQLLVRVLGVTRPQADVLFPGYVWDASLDGILKV